MAKQKIVSAELETVFAAMGDATRLAVIRTLSTGSKSVSELAADTEMALPSFLQHLKVLEDAGLTRSVKSGRVRMVTLQDRQLKKADKWMAKRRASLEKASAK